MSVLGRRQRSNFEAGIHHHQERHDGHGYPGGLTAAEIPEGAALLAVADAWDAMTVARSYGVPRTLPDAIDEMRRTAGTQFSPQAIEAHHPPGPASIASGVVPRAAVIGKVPPASAMPTRFWTRRGFRLEVTVPNAFARPIRTARANRTRTSPGRAGDRPHQDASSHPDPPPLQHQDGALTLRIGPPRELRATKRDPRAALAFIADFADKSSDARGAGGFPAPVDQAETDTSGRARLADTVARLPWYHTIEMPGGVVSRGMFDHRPLVAHYGIPHTLEGSRCLDIACSNGFWAFEFERRGGRVTAVDIGSWADWDVPAGAPLPFPAAEVADPDEPADLGADPFEVAKAALGSSVERVQRNLYALDPADLGTFDFVHAGDVLLHLARPLDALRVMHRLTAPGGTALIADVIDPELSEPSLTRYFGGFDRHLWWMPGLDCLAQMVYDAGFSEVELVTTYNLAPWDLPEGHWRAVLRARP